MGRDEILPTYRVPALVRAPHGWGGPDRNRTDDLIHAMDALYQLSYGPGPKRC
jgi:hypothetical protein